MAAGIRNHSIQCVRRLEDRPLIFSLYKESSKRLCDNVLFMPHHPAHIAIWITTWLLCGLVFILILWRPRRIPEYVWAVAGAALLVLFRLLPLRAAWSAVRSGTDVYLFLAGMMLLAELGAQPRRLRLARGRGDGTCPRISDTPLCAGIQHRHRGDGAAVQRRDGRPANARCAGRRSPRKNFPAALLICLRVHCQCRQFRSANFESGESGRLRWTAARIG